MIRLAKFTNWLTEKIQNKSKRPWGQFTVSGINEGMLRFQMQWNQAFLDNLHDNGFRGTSDEETVQNFLLGSLMWPKELNVDNTINSDEHPFLDQPEQGRIVK
ncbi:MAG: hypothetical protein QXN55_01600 [Candidatus Nitrosotenuis sp.]